jgi:hypothetical protein
VCFDLLIQYPKGDVLEEGNHADLIIEKHLLIDHIDQVAILNALKVSFSGNLVCNPLGKSLLGMLAENRVATSLVLG